MSETGAGQDVNAGGATAGSLLREAREAAGLHVATLAANLKVPVRKLEALEEDRYDLLPDAVFVRALASSVCRSLKIDPQPVLERLPQSSQPRLPQEGDGLGAPFRAPSDGPRPGALDAVSRPVAFIVLALLLGALVLVFLPERRDAAAPGVAAGTAEPVMPPPGASPQPEQLAAAPAAPAGEVAPGATPAAAASGMAAVAPAGLQPGTAAPASTAAVVTPAAPPPAPAASAPAATGTVVFRTRGPSWIEVTDANGNTQLRRLLGPGESAGASGQLPLSVTVGDASQTDVQVRGKPFDLATITRDNVARFEVK